jgi:glucosamine 6-phosphate synthetase-like amidotransferase/phosphosugar isomerase protein
LSGTTGKRDGSGGRLSRLLEWKNVLCGIAGYSLSRSSGVDPTLAAQTLMAAISERGSDAAGYCFRGPGLKLKVHKRRAGASQLLDAISVPDCAAQVLVHVRDYTKGHPSLTANNHPVRHGSVVGVHNGIIRNDEEIFARHGFTRASRGMTVDSEAIFALAEQERSRAHALEELYGSMATAWLDERDPDVLFLARGIGRPLWIGEGEQELFFASTRDALELVERYTDLRLRKRELAEGMLVAAVEGKVVRSEAFEPDRTFTEEALPAVRAPEERQFCLTRLAALATAAAGR